MSDFEPFSLADLIDTCRDAGPNPHDIAAKVEPLIPESERHNVFLMLLAREVIRSKLRLTEVIGSAQRETRPTTTTKSAPAGSAKVKAYQAYARLLAMDVKVSAVERKFMKYCTFEDLTYAALIRRELAAGCLAEAEEYEYLASLLKKHKVETVASSVGPSPLCGHAHPPPHPVRHQQRPVAHNARDRRGGHP